MSQNTHFGTSLFSLQNLHEVLLHVDINCTVAGKRTATFDVAGESWYKVRILDQLVDVADEGTTGHVAAGNLVDWDFNLCPSHGV